MRSNSAFFYLQLSTIALLVAGCGGGSGGSDPDVPPEVDTTLIVLESDDGDFIGRGGNYSYTSANAIIAIEPTGQYFTVEIDGDETWDGRFLLPSAYTELQPGSYIDLDDFGSHDPAVGAIDWSGQGSGCTSSGWLIIDKATYVDEVLTELEIQFEHRCGSNPSSPALRGTINWYANDPVMPAGPVHPPPTDLWEPDPDLLPDSGNYAYFDSEPGDIVAGGFDYLFTEPDAIFSVDSGSYSPWLPDPYLRISVSPEQGSGWRDARFQTMNTLTVFEPGYYGDLRRFPFHNVTKGGMEIGGFGVACNSLSGWFVIDQISYSGDEVSSVELRFEQRCDGATGSLFGKIRWSQ